MVESDTIRNMLRNLRSKVSDVYREALKKMISIDQLGESLELKYHDITEELDEKELLIVIRNALDKQPYVIRKTFLYLTFVTSFECLYQTKNGIFMESDVLRCIFVRFIHIMGSWEVEK